MTTDGATSRFKLNFSVRIIMRYDMISRKQKHLNQPSVQINVPKYSYHWRMAKICTAKITAGLKNGTSRENFRKIFVQLICSTA